jgi:AcrR family transcriptional regulator
MADIDDGRDRLVRAADSLFYARGIQAVGMDAVRTAAGVSLKRIYQLFPSKDDLVLAVLEHRTRTWDAGLEAAATGAGTPRERLLAIFDFLDAWFCEPDFRGCGFINAFGELGASSPGVAEAVRAQKASFQRYVARLVAEAGGPPSVATQIALLAEGAQTMAAISGDREVAKRAREAAVVLLDSSVDARAGLHDQRSAEQDPGASVGARQ